MNISQLIEVLRSRMEAHGDVEVEITWEGTFHPISPPLIYLSKSGELYIDAENNFYKKEFAVDPLEGGVLCEDSEEDW